MRINPWAFGMVFLILAGYFIWNQFRLPIIFLGETAETKAKIVEIEIVRRIVGRGYNQKLLYVYFVDNQLFKDERTIGTEYSMQFIGNRMAIEYEIDNPKKHQVTGMFNDFNGLGSYETSFLFSQTKGYEEFILSNGLFFYKDYAKGGMIKEEFYGEFDIINDTLKLIPFIENGLDLSISDIYLIRTDTTDRESLFDLETKKEYKNNG